jgi:hypothetical protein
MRASPFFYVEPRCVVRSGANPLQLSTRSFHRLDLATLTMRTPRRREPWWFPGPKRAYRLCRCPAFTELFGDCLRRPPVTAGRTPSLPALSASRYPPAGVAVTRDPCWLCRMPSTRTSIIRQRKSPPRSIPVSSTTWPVPVTSRTRTFARPWAAGRDGRFRSLPPSAGPPSWTQEVPGVPIDLPVCGRRCRWHGMSPGRSGCGDDEVACLMPSAEAHLLPVNCR